jgi:hypothetical protein
MAHDTTEIYVRGLSEEEAVAWLDDMLEGLEQVREQPIVTYEGQYDGATVPVQITEHVRDGPYTSLWFNTPNVPWDSVRDCARAAHAALGAEVLCYLDRPEEPWILLRMIDGEATHVDERDLDGP